MKLAACLVLVACAARPPAVKVAADLPALVSTDGVTEGLGTGITVIEFFSAHCPCQRAHDQRLSELYAHFHTAGVRFLVVDVEADSSLAIDQREAQERHYPFPIWRDDSGSFADYFQADYATYSVVLDGKGHLAYRGGIDSDKVYLQSNAEPWLRDAVSAVLAGQAPRKPETKSFGCELRRR